MDITYSYRSYNSPDGLTQSYMYYKQVAASSLGTTYGLLMIDEMPPHVAYSELDNGNSQTRQLT